MDKSILIGDQKVGQGHPVYIIAEVGVNHNGDLELAKKLIYEAALCALTV
jgi:N-acetylneuraminate synthase